MKTHLEWIGGLLLLLGVLHAGFPRYFNWTEDLKSVSLLNRQMMYVHTLFVALIVMLMGALCLGYAASLTSTALGRTICLGLGLFWLTRLGVQFFGYSAELWRGKRFETVVHVVFSLLWTYLSIVFFAVYWQ